ncbi:MAG TPA: protein kinase [Candidatus Acidoferrum sp.]|nr:protein kinase [Candidatus Acidoferrum sp.]
MSLEKLGKYLIQRELGRGAGGVVYRARDPIINRLVALKTITTGLAEYPDLLQRFYQEAQSAGGLQHPNIVTIYDLGDADGIPYIAMELLEGESLDQLISRRAALPVPLKLTYVLQACRALDYAHKRGIIHRDIKPDNVMLTRDGTVKVVDFGIARVLETSKTQTGMLLGTFAYMSPEQYHGEHADARSDIWSFGVLLYELLAYQRPFRGSTPASLMHSICQQEPTPLLEVAPECPAALEKVVQKVLRKSPDERYQSMEEVLLDLDPICKSLQAESVAALVVQARNLSEQGDYSQSRDLLRQALQIDSTNSQARNLLEKANTELRRILIRPKLQQQIEKGRELLAEGKTQEARVEAEVVLQLDPTFEPGQELLKRVQQEMDRARQIAEWIDAAEQRLAQGLLEEAEELLAKVLEGESTNQQAKALQLQVTSEKAERQRRAQFFEKMQQARGLWTQQNYAECIQLLVELRKEFPDDDEIPRLLETAQEDQANQRRSQGLADARSMLANRRYDECTALLAELRKQFPGDDEILKLQKTVFEDQRKQRRAQSVAEVRSLLAARRYDDCTSLLNSILKEFPGDDEVLQLQRNVLEDQRKERRSQSIAEVRSLFAARRHDACTTLLNSILKEFPGDDETLQLQKNVLDDQRKQRMLDSLSEARNILAAKRYDDCISRLTSLQKEFPEEADVSRLLETAKAEKAEQQRQQSVAKARKLLAGRRYDECNTLLLELQTQFPKDDEIPKLLDVVRKDQSEQRKLQGLTEARSLLHSRNYEGCLALLGKLQGEHPNDNDVAKLLETALGEQAEQRKLKSLSEARSLLTSRNYEECLALLAKLQSQYPKDNDILKLIEIAREDRAEQQKQRQLADARNHLAARRFADAMGVLDGLREAHPKDSAVIKLRTLALQEKEKQDSLERLQGELKAIKNLVSEKKYNEVLAQSERIQKEFPGNTDLSRLIEFSKAQQAEIERETQQKAIFQEVKKLFDSSHFEEAYQAALAGLKTFPDNKELQLLREQADNQQRKLETRQHIEQRIREIKVKINRGKISDAIDLAKQTLMTLGPDTDVNQLLNSARVEFEARERKKDQEEKLEAVRALISAGKLVEATKTLDLAVEAKILEVFDPRVQRVCEELDAAKSAATAAAATVISAPPVSRSKEYAWLQGPPEPEVATPEETRPPTEVPGAKASAGQTVLLPTQPVVPPAVPPHLPPPPAESVPRVSAPPQRPEKPVTKPTREPMVERAAPIAPSPTPTPTVALPPPSQPRREIKQSVPQVSIPEAIPVAGVAPPSNRRKTARIGALVLCAVGLIWGLIRIATLLGTHETAPTPTVAKPTAKPEPNPLEVQQRDALKAADKLVASNDLEGALKILSPAADLNGPFTAEIKKKQASIEESMQNQNLRDLRRREELLWQQANDDVTSGRFADAQKKLHQILALGDGGLRKNDAQQTLAHTIPDRQAEEKLFSQARQAAQKSDINSLQSASDILSRLASREGPRKPEAEKMLQDVRAKLSSSYVSSARQDLQRGDFHAARQKAGQIQQSGSDAGALSTEIDQAEQSRLTQLESQFNQLKQSDDDAAAQQLSNLQRGFQALADSAGPRSEEAKGYVNNLPEAIREVHERAASKRAETAYGQIVARYQQASNTNDKTGLEAARTGFQAIAKAGGPHASEAQRFVDEIGTKLAALNQPPPVVTPVPPPPVSAPVDNDAVLALVTRYSQAFEQRNPDALRQIWPTMGTLYTRYKNSFEKASSIRMQVQTETVKIGADGNTATVTAQVTQEYTPQGEKPKSVKGRTIFQFAKSNGSWVITNVQ